LGLVNGYLLSHRLAKKVQTAYWLLMDPFQMPPALLVIKPDSENTTESSYVQLNTKSEIVSSEVYE
jgi:hypothetical protein